MIGLLHSPGPSPVNHLSWPDSRAAGQPGSRRRARQHRATRRQSPSCPELTAIGHAGRPARSAATPAPTRGSSGCDGPGRDRPRAEAGTAGSRALPRRGGPAPAGGPAPLPRASSSDAEPSPRAGVRGRPTCRARTALHSTVTPVAPKIRGGGYIFLARRSDHPTRHVHVYRNGRLFVAGHQRPFPCAS